MSFLERIKPVETSAPEPRVGIDVIDPWEHNPRTQPHPDYADIKTSILANGLLESLQIAKRPGSARYVLTQGGKTRLSILNELYAETQQERFFYPPIDIVDWPGEWQVLSRHWGENLQSPLSFGDKARHLWRMKEFLEAELRQSFALREAAERLTERGTAVSHSFLSLADFAVNVLSHHAPKLLTRVGQNKCAEVRKLYGHVARLYQLGAHAPALEEGQRFAERSLKAIDDSWEQGVELAVLKQRWLEEVAIELSLSYSVIEKASFQLDKGKTPSFADSKSVPTGVPSEASAAVATSANRAPERPLASDQERYEKRRTAWLKKVRKQAQALAIEAGFDQAVIPTGDGFQVKVEGNGIVQQVLRCVSGQTDDISAEVKDFLKLPNRQTEALWRLLELNRRPPKPPQEPQEPK